MAGTDPRNKSGDGHDGLGDRCRTSIIRAVGMSPSEVESLKRQANGLHADEEYFGKKHWTGRKHEEIYKEMRTRHPGFGQVSYELALQCGIVMMR